MSAPTPPGPSPRSATGGAAPWSTRTSAGCRTRGARPGDAGPARVRADLADVDALLPADDEGAALASVALMELGAVVCTAQAPRCGTCPAQPVCAWVAAGHPDYAGPRRAVQAFAGTDRQVRGRLMEVLRGSPEPVERAVLDAAWADAAQRDRCLDSLLADGLAEQLDDGRFALPA